MADTIPGHEKEAVAVRRKTHSAHPNAALSAIAVVVPDICLRHKRARLHGEAGCNRFRRNINSNDEAGVVVKIAVSAKCAINIISNLNKGWSLQDRSSDEMGCWPVVTGRAIDQDGVSRNIRQRIDIDTVEIVHAIIYTCRAYRSVVGDVCLGEEVDNVGGGVNRRCANDADGIWNVWTSNLGLEEGIMHSTLSDQVTCLSIQGPNNILR